MKKQTFLLNEQTYGLVVETIAHAEHDGSLQVSIGPVHESRSIAQNALYWAWLSALSEDTGNTKTSLHYTFSTDHLLPIYLEEPKNVYQTFIRGLISPGKYLESISSDQKYGLVPKNIAN